MNKEKEIKKITIDLKFVCPIDNEQEECEFFGRETHFCPYAPFDTLGEREELPDCPHAPKQIWKNFKNQKERKEYADLLGK